MQSGECVIEFVFFAGLDVEKNNTRSWKRRSSNLESVSFLSVAVEKVTKMHLR